MYEGAKLLITGGAGFLGGNLVKQLAEQAAALYILDDLYTGKQETLPHLQHVHFVQGSVTDGALLRELIKEVDYIFHFAARNITLSVMQPESDFRVNVEGTVQVLLNSLPYKHRIKRIVYASTASIYGNSEVLPASETLYDISVPYSASKMAGEVLAIAYGKTFNLPVTCLRFSNVYGPGQIPANPYCGVVSKFFEAYQNNLPLTIFGDGTQTRDFTFVEDAIQATLLAAKSPNTLYEVLNVGTGIETTINDLAKTVLAAVGKPNHPIVFSEKRKIDTVYRRCLDAQKLQATTAWKPNYSLQTGIAKTWEWFLHESKL